MPGCSGTGFAARKSRLDLMHRKIGADAVAGAMVVIQPALPKRVARQHIEMRAGDAFRKNCLSQGDMTSEHTRHMRLYPLPGLALARSIACG